MPRYGTLNSDYLASWFERDEPGGPMWALNLMKYREWAEYADGRETNLTGAEAVVPYFEEAGFVQLEPWLDPDADFAGAYGVNVGLPLTVLYDAAGRELWRYSGDRDWTDAESRALVEEALGGE